jgi:regulator of replication initiation timing
MIEVRRMADEQRAELEQAEQMLQQLTESILATLRDVIEENTKLRAENVELRRRLAAYEPPEGS